MDAIERLAAETRARVIRQHVSEDFYSLPAFPILFVDREHSYLNGVQPHVDRRTGALMSYPRYCPDVTGLHRATFALAGSLMLVGALAPLPLFDRCNIATAARAHAVLR